MVEFTWKADLLGLPGILLSTDGNFFFFLEWAYLGCLNDRKGGLSQHLPDEKSKSTTFAPGVLG